MSGLVSLLLLAALGFFFLWFPLTVARDCAKSTELSSSSRTAWMIAIVVLFPIASWLYAIVGPTTKRAKTLGATSFAVAAAMTLLIGQFLGGRADAIRSELDAVADRMANASTNVSDDRRATLTRELAEVRDEITANPLHIDRNASAMDLVEMLTAQLGDNSISTLEFERWDATFQGRHNTPDNFMLLTMRVARALGQPQAQFDDR